MSREQAIRDAQRAGAVRDYRHAAMLYERATAEHNERPNPTTESRMNLASRVFYDACNRAREMGISEEELVEILRQPPDPGT